MYFFSDAEISSDEEEGTSWWPRLGFGVLLFFIEILLFGSLGLALYWVYQYHGGLAWEGNTTRQYNLHYVLMIGAFVFLNGQAIVAYRTYTCCKVIYVKVLHTIIFMASLSCAALGLVAAIQVQNNYTRPRHFYSLHAWLGLGALGLFGLQFLVGFVSFLVLLCCSTATAKFRQQLVPTHATFGLITLGLGLAASLTGLMQSARFRLSGKDGRPEYKELPEEALVVNVLGISIILSAILIVLLVRTRSFRRPTAMLALN